MEMSPFAVLWKPQENTNCRSIVLGRSALKGYTEEGRRKERTSEMK